MSEIQNDKCATCGKDSPIQIVMNDWYWLRRGSIGHWFCSFPCVGASEMKLNPHVRYKPTPEESQRMQE